MAINPVKFAHNICEEFLRYIFSAFPITDPDLARQARLKLMRSSSLDIPLGERQVKAYPRTQTDRRTVGKANGRRIIGAFRKMLFGSTFRFVLTCLDFPHDEAR